MKLEEENDEIKKDKKKIKTLIEHYTKITDSYHELVQFYKEIGKNKPQDEILFPYFMIQFDANSEVVAKKMIEMKNCIYSLNEDLNNEKYLRNHKKMSSKEKGDYYHNKAWDTLKEDN